MAKDDQPPQVILPDPDPEWTRRERARLLRISPGDNRLVTPKRTDWENQTSPRLIRRKVLHALRSQAEDAVTTVGTLLKDNRDPRVQLQAATLVITCTTGKPGENVTENDGSNLGAGIDMAAAMKHLSIEECDRLNDALNVIAEMKSIIATRMASDG